MELFENKTIVPLGILIIPAAIDFLFLIFLSYEETFNFGFVCPL